MKRISKHLKSTKHMISLQRIHVRTDKRAFLNSAI